MNKVVSERKFKWEMLHGNGKKLEVAVVAKFPKAQQF